MTQRQIRKIDVVKLLKSDNVIAHPSQNHEIWLILSLVLPARYKEQQWNICQQPAVM